VVEPAPRPEGTNGAGAQPAPHRLRNVAIVVCVGVVALFVAAAFLPRWWSHRVADQAGGSFTSGILLGLFYGFVFTLLPLAVIWIGLRRSHTWKGRVVTVIVALVVAFPNVLTASIVLGWGNAAHAGERTLDVEAPGFRWSTLLGVLAAAVLALLIGYLVQSRREARAHARALGAGIDEPPPPTTHRS
jgi:hypothetical protein